MRGQWCQDAVELGPGADAGLAEYLVQVVVDGAFADVQAGGACSPAPGAARTAAGGEARDRPAEGAARPVNREPQLLLQTGVVAGIPRLRAGEDVK